MASDLALLSTNGMDQQDMASELLESSTQAANDILVPSAPNAKSVDIVAPPDLPSEAPRSPGGVNQISMNSRPSRDARVVWQSVFCPICSLEDGQYKYDPHPGQRDPPTWMYRVADETGGFVVIVAIQVFNIFVFVTCSGRFHNTGPTRKRTYATIIDEEGVENWLFQNKERCRCG